MLYKTISSKAVIGEVISRFGITDANIELDALEWVGYAIALIGTHANFINIVEEVEVDFYKIQYPCNFYQLNFIAHKGQKLKYGAGASYIQGGEQSDDPLVMDLIKSVFVKRELATIIEETDACTPEAEDLMNKEELLNTRIANLASFVESSASCSRELWYSNNPSGNCYDTNIECGSVIISYKAYPLDKEGYPLILDEVKYRLALEWYIFRCICERGYRHPVIDYSMADQKFNIALQQARNEHLKMTYEEVEDFTYNWTNMLRERDRGNNNYYSN